MDTSSIYNPDDTICAIATPQGTGAIAMVRLSGPDAFTIADKVWQGRSLARTTTHTAHLGYIVDHNSGDTIDQAVATVFRAPNSFTGDDTVEFAIHGSRWIQRRF
ncbi:MAG: tRNA uridine-5-carboxymethylaminomethyl(34) synthesis GTPase MnmE, partial [Muribaculaceae bacterium]|nr:tRNA uridine-5-carboxymethylaminomethyl(34) synthesis GTPase MnmE [Muribaculaceae bacterium]